MTVVFCGGACIAQDIHILLRPREGKASFHLGEPIVLEVACIDPVSQQYLLPCVVVLQAEAASPSARLSADRIDQTTWLDAQSGNLPPGPVGGCGNIDNQLPSHYSDSPTWQQVKLKEPFPVYVGQYKVRALLAFDLEMAGRFGEPTKHSSSDEIQISLDDNLDWKAHLIRIHNCDYDDRLTLTRIRMLSLRYKSISDSVHSTTTNRLPCYWTRLFG